MLALAALACEAQERAEVRRERFEAIEVLDVQRLGTVSFQAVSLAEGEPGETATVRYALAEPLTRVEDTDIRGYMEGTIKYPYNQGTAYHMRMGRRYGGPRKGRYELKRTLLRFHLPPLPERARVVDSSLVLWVEKFMLDSPLSGQEPIDPLHVLAYPTRQGWGAGRGGTRRNDFSPAAPGESNWVYARAGAEPWASPGALPIGGDGPYEDSPLALGRLRVSDAELVLRGAALDRYVERRMAGDEPVDLLVKLDDQEEDRWGTEVAVFSSDFGVDWDAVSRRPRLELALEVPGRVERIEQEVILEAGSQRRLPVQRHSGGPVLLAGRVEGEGPGIAPTLWVRGGRGPMRGDEPFESLANPLIRDWTWSEVLVSAQPHAVTWGEPLTLSLRETWVKPGPREEQLPEFQLISPSGERFTLYGESDDDLRYTLRFTPHELGLWRYSWFFRPAPTRDLRSHVGEGAFWVDITGDDELEAMSDYLAETMERGGEAEKLVMQLESFVRVAIRHAARRPDEAQRALALVDRVLDN